MVENISLIQKQKCQEYNSEVVAILEDEKVGIALETLHLQPIYGVRTSPVTGSSGWFFWGGEYSDAENFFQSIHSKHLEAIFPVVIDFLCLSPRHKFIIDNQGYEDVWFDETLVNNK